MGLESPEVPGGPRLLGEYPAVNVLSGKRAPLVASAADSGKVPGPGVPVLTQLRIWALGCCCPCGRWPADRGQISGSDSSLSTGSDIFCSEARLGTRKGRSNGLNRQWSHPGSTSCSQGSWSSLGFLSHCLRASARSPWHCSMGALWIAVALQICSQKRDLEIPGPHTALNLLATERRAGIGATW